jgi:hypothetical protein
MNLRLFSHSCHVTNFYSDKILPLKKLYILRKFITTHCYVPYVKYRSHLTSLLFRHVVISDKKNLKLTQFWWPSMVQCSYQVLRESIECFNT